MLWTHWCLLTVWEMVKGNSMAVQMQCNSSFDPICYEEGSGSLAVIIIPSLLALSTLIVVCQIIWSFLTKRSSARVTTGSPTNVNDRSTQQEAKEFVDLVLFLASVSKHKNIVKMLYCQTHRTPMYLVLEASIPGNLLHFLWILRGDSSETVDNLQGFSERSIYLVAKQVAAGLDYLHSYHRVVHGDVAARNMLISSGFSVRVSGLDLAFQSRQARIIDNEMDANVPLKWQAPERIMRCPLTDRSDVWSFGILLYELTTLGSPPYPDLEPSEMLPQTLSHYRMQRPENCGAPLYDLMKYCCMWNFKDRPVYSAIIRLLDSYIYLADTRPLRCGQQIDICEYRRKAGLAP